MDPFASLHPTPKAWLLNSPLAPHIDAFVAHLRRGRYAGNTTSKYGAGIAHFAHWMTQCSFPVQLLNEQTVDQFLNSHLPCCDCPMPVRRVHGDLRAALGHLLVVLREQGVIAEPPQPVGDIVDELRRYDEHMHKARGLSADTGRGCPRSSACAWPTCGARCCRVRASARQRAQAALGAAVALDRQGGPGLVETEPSTWLHFGPAAKPRR